MFSWLEGDTPSKLCFGQTLIWSLALSLDRTQRWVFLAGTMTASPTPLDWVKHLLPTTLLTTKNSQEDRCRSWFGTEDSWAHPTMFIRSFKYVLSNSTMNARPTGTTLGTKQCWKIFPESVLQSNWQLWQESSNGARLYLTDTTLSGTGSPSTTSMRRVSSWVPH